MVRKLNARPWGKQRGACSPGDDTMKYLIINGDDFGASYGINRGIIETHQRGILTSTSLLVHARWSEDAAALSRTAPDLSVGLHVDVGSTGEDCMTDFRSHLQKALSEQYPRF